MRRRVLVVLVVVLAVVGVVLGAAYLFQRQLIYLPSDGPVPPANAALPGARDVSFETSDGLRLRGWYLPARSAPGPTVLVAPGNAGNRSIRAPLATALAERGLSVLLLDYRGYGGNPGSPTETGLALDVRAARSYLVDDVGVPRDQLVYYGESLGAGVVTELATEYPPAGLVLRSPFTDLASVGKRHYPILPVNLLLKDRFPVAEHARRIRAPATVVYGRADSIVPPAQSRAVAAAFPHPAHLVEVRGAGHNDPVLLDGAQLIDSIVRAAKG
ncbi:MAG: alpha/beta fold hydrolase [Pseudonocardiaceae bacterium]|nr:alpha/beta fold hydrolase [Pseudonocardiaceae bacterium]